MPFIPSSFQRLMEPLDRRLLARAVARHEGDRGVGSGDNAWTCARHLKALVFAQVAGLGSLREIVDLDLSGQAVILSACSSAGGALLQGEGPMGPARAFFQAEARAVALHG